MKRYRLTLKFMWCWKICEVWHDDSKNKMKGRRLYETEINIDFGANKELIIWKNNFDINYLTDM